MLDSGVAVLSLGTSGVSAKQVGIAPAPSPIGPTAAVRFKKSRLLVISSGRDSGKIIRRCRIKIPGQALRVVRWLGSLMGGRTISGGALPSRVIRSQGT